MYKPDLAAIHDLHFDNVPVQASQFVLAQMPDLQGPVLDLGCGAGNFLAALAHKVPQAFGADVSAAMINRAQQKLPQYTFEVAGLFESTLHKAQLISATGEVLNYACARLDDPYPALQKFFERVFHHLTPQGALLFDYLTDEYAYTTTRVLDKKGFTLLAQIEQQGNQIKRHITTFSQVPNQPDVYTKSTELHQQRLFNTPMLVATLNRVGFKVQVPQAYQAHLLPGRAACYCLKV